MGLFLNSIDLDKRLIDLDLGFGDLGYAGSGIATPHLDRLRAEGVELTNFFAQPICTPTRGAFLTGRYPLLLGLQGKETVQQGQAWGLDLREQTFVSAFQAAGWATHMVGKVHLGADYWRRTPTYRGFDTFVGYLYGAEDYFTHKLAQGFDLRNDTRPMCGPGCSANIAVANNGTYSSVLFGAEVARLVRAARGPTYIHFTPQAGAMPHQTHPPPPAPAATTQLTRRRWRPARLYPPRPRRTERARAKRGSGRKGCALSPEVPEQHHPRNSRGRARLPRRLNRRDHGGRDRGGPRQRHARRVARGQWRPARAHG